MESTISRIELGDGGTLAYREWGHKQDPAVVLIHSLAMTGDFWKGVGERIARHDYRVIAPDCRGHGLSSLKPDLTVERAADDVAELLDSLGVATACVAGASMGGSIALALAIRHGRRTCALGLVDTTAWYGEGAPKAWDERAQKARKEGLGGLVDFQRSRWFTEGFRQQNPQEVEQVVNVFLSNDIEGYAAACRLLGSCDLRTGLPKLSVPTAIIVGEEDYATPPAMAEYMARSIPGAEMQVLPGLRHLTPLEAPDRVAEILLGVFDKARRQEDRKWHLTR